MTLPLPPGQVADVVDELQLVDHHCHGVVAADLDRPAFEAMLTEGTTAPGSTSFDTALGFAVRRHCAPLLDLPPHAEAATYVSHRLQLGADQANRRLLSAAGVTGLCVDTGLPGLADPAQLAALAGEGVRAYEIVRLESLAEDIADRGVDAAEFADRFETALDVVLREDAAPRVVGLKSIAAYRTGLDLDPARPSRAELTAAVAGWLGRIPGDGRPRLEDPVVVRALLWSAVDRDLPIQVHTGFGDTDLRLDKADPTLLTDWLRKHRTPVMLLHCWPYHRQAGYLASAYPHVYVDVGLAMPYVGPLAAVDVLTEIAELAPFDKLLYSSDAYGLSELHYLGALCFRRALAALLQRQLGSGEWSRSDAVRVAQLVGSGNAQRVYGL